MPWRKSEDMGQVQNHRAVQEHGAGARCWVRVCAEGRFPLAAEAGKRGYAVKEQPPSCPVVRGCSPMVSELRVACGNFCTAVWRLGREKVRKC